MILNTLRTSDKPLIYSLMLLAFLMPLHKKFIVPAFILFAFFLLFRFSFSRFFQNIKHKPALLLPILFFCLSALSLIWTENMDDGLFDLEVKLSFLLLPVLFLMMPFATDEKNTEKILKSYVVGVFVGIIICLIWATFQYIKQPVIYYTFVSSRLSIFHHPTYFAMYINLALIILLFYQRTHKMHYIPAYAGAVILLSFNWLLMSRSGLLTAVFIVLFYWISLFFEKKFKTAIIILLVFVSSVFTMAHFSNYAIKRLSTVMPFINDLFDNDSSQHAETGTDSRLVTWSAAIHAIKQHPFIGVGPGDVHDILNTYYEEQGHSVALKLEFNAHNQFLQSWVAKGIGGFLLVFGMIVYGFARNRKELTIIVAGFFAILSITMLIESIFETQSGVVFFCFFTSFFYSIKRIGSNTKQKII